MSDNNYTYTGPGFLGLLTLLFIGLKLSNNINWSWWWVLSPIWLPIGVVLGILCILVLIGAIIEVFKK